MQLLNLKRHYIQTCCKVFLPIFIKKINMQFLHRYVPYSSNITRILMSHMTRFRRHVRASRPTGWMTWRWGWVSWISWLRRHLCAPASSVPSPRRLLHHRCRTSRRHRRLHFPPVPVWPEQPAPNTWTRTGICCVRGKSSSGPFKSNFIFILLNTQN